MEAVLRDWAGTRFGSSIIAKKLTLITLFLIATTFLSFAMPAFNAGIMFSIVVALSFVLFRPTYLLEPLTVLIFYYGLFFITPLFASRYGSISFTHEFVVYAYQLATITFAIGAVVLFLMRTHRAAVDKREPLAHLRKFHLELFAALNLPICIVFGYLLFESTGGLARWSELGGLAILQRRGSGGITVAFIFTSFVQLSVLGYLGLVQKRYSYLLLGIALLILFSPLYGGKLRIAQATMMLFAPLIIRARLFSFSTILLGVFFFLMFIAVNAWRAASWITFKHFIPGSFQNIYISERVEFGYVDFNSASFDGTQQTIWSHSLNYFDVLENMIIAFRDFENINVITIFLPFNKLKELWGVNLEAADYDMSSMLTQIYYPKIYELGATTQWPIEIDLWLSFGLSPLWIVLIPFFFFFGYLYNLSFRYSGPAFYFAWVFVYGYMISHLRGGYFLWTDLYVFPILLFYIFVLTFLFRARPETTSTAHPVPAPVRTKST